MLASWKRLLEKNTEKIPLLKENFVHIEQNPETLSLFEKILTIDPERYDLRMFLSEAYRRGGDFPRAEVAFKEALAMPFFSSTSKKDRPNGAVLKSLKTPV